MRVLVGSILAATLLVTSAFAEDAAGPLAPGKPAGVEQAQGQNSHAIWWTLGAGLVIGGIAILESSNGGNKGGVPSGGPSTNGTTR